MWKRSLMRLVPAVESLERNSLLSTFAGAVPGAVQVAAEKKYLLDGTLQDIGRLSHLVIIPGVPRGQSYIFSADDLFGRLKSAGQVGGPHALTFARSVVVVPAGVTPPAISVPVTVPHPGDPLDLRGATLTLTRVNKAGKMLRPKPAAGTLVLSLDASPTRMYRYTVTWATGTFAPALGGTGTLAYDPARGTLKLRSDRV